MSQIRGNQYLVAVGAAGLSVALLFGCASTLDSLMQESQQVLAPSGKLRVGLNLGSPNSLIRDAKSGESKGLAFDLGRELARRLGVPFEPVIFDRAALMFEAVKSGEVDLVFSNATAEIVKGHVDFTPPLIQLESGYLVAPGSRIATIANIDQPGIKVGVTKGSTSGAVLSRQLKYAIVVPVLSNNEVPALLAAGKVDAFATNKGILFELSDKSPGSRVIEGHYGMEYLAFGIPKGRERGMVYLRKFSEDVKSEGFVERAIKRVGLRGATQSNSL